MLTNLFIDSNKLAVANEDSETFTEKWKRICWVITDKTSIRAFMLDPRYEQPSNTGLSDWESCSMIKLFISVALNKAYEDRAFSAEMLLLIQFIYS